MLINILIHIPFEKERITYIIIIGFAAIFVEIVVILEFWILRI